MRLKFNSSGEWEWISEVMWSVVMWSELTWFMWSDFILKWSESSVTSQALIELDVFSDSASWTDYILITNLMHWLLFIKCYSPPHVSSLRCSSSGGYSCIHPAYGTVTLYESSWWPVGTQLEWELIQSDSTICWMYTTVSSWRWALETRNL